MQFIEPAINTSLGKIGEREFEQVFKIYFKNLHAYAYTILKDEAAGEEIVQNVLYKLWEKRERLDIKISIKAYLYKAVYHESLNYLKHQQIKAIHQTYAMRYSENTTENTQRKVLLSELEKRLGKALNELPQQCRTIFQMSRFEELKYHEIASSLGISIKTVENQMGKALKLLRRKLADYLPLILIVLLRLNNAF